MEEYLTIDHAHRAFIYCESIIRVDAGISTGVKLGPDPTVRAQPLTIKVVYQIILNKLIQ